MIGQVMKRVFLRDWRHTGGSFARSRSSCSTCVASFHPFSTSGTDYSSYIFNRDSNHELPQMPPVQSASESSSSSAANRAGHFEAQKGEHRGNRFSSGFNEEQISVLRASLSHVKNLGWAEASLVAGAKDVGISPSVIGSFQRKDAALVEYFMDRCLERLAEITESGQVLVNLVPSECISKLVRLRLEMQAEYISRWPQALSIQAHPLNAPTSLKQRAVLVDHVWNAVGTEAADIGWFVKRTILGGIYSSTEVYMLTDNSPDFEDTWKFLDGRVKDYFDMKKTIQEAKYLAEAVGAGLESSIRGFIKAF